MNITTSDTRSPSPDPTDPPTPTTTTTTTIRPQTLYKTPYTYTTFILVLLIPGIATIISWIAIGFNSPLTRSFLFLYFTLQLVLLVIDPDTCFVCFTRRNPADGGRTKIRVRRPLVGFKRYETQVGLTGGYEVRYDGWRYERALLRI